jgi:hypothetical protein
MTRLIVFVLLFASLPGLGQSTAATKDTDSAVLTWDENSFDFGNIRQGEKVEHTFKFRNTGSQPLVITNVSTQCGCTTPKGWPRDPVMPGAQGEITISFDSAGKIGRQNKVATIISNAANTKSNQLLLSGIVTEKLP